MKSVCILSLLSCAHLYWTKAKTATVFLKLFRQSDTQDADWAHLMTGQNMYNKLTHQIGLNYFTEDIWTLRCKYKKIQNNINILNIKQHANKQQPEFSEKISNSLFYLGMFWRRHQILIRFYILEKWQSCENPIPIYRIHFSILCICCQENSFYRKLNFTLFPKKQKIATCTWTSNQGLHPRIFAASWSRCHFEWIVGQEGIRRERRVQLHAGVTMSQRQQTHWPHSSWCGSPIWLYSFLKHNKHTKVFLDKPMWLH